MSTTVSTSFSRRFGYAFGSDRLLIAFFRKVGEELSSVLSRFSIDLVGVVCSYAVCGVATAGAQPNLLFSFGSEQSSSAFADSGDEADKMNGGCMSLACAYDGTVWAGSYGGVHVFDCNGNFIRRVKPADSSAWRTGIACVPSGEVFVCASSDHQITAYSAQGEALRTMGELGEKGSEGGKWCWPWGLCMNKKGQLVVADSSNYRVKIVEPDGSFVRVFGSQGGGDGEFMDARGIGCTEDGRIMVVDADDGSVQVCPAFRDFQMYLTLLCCRCLMRKASF